MAPYTIPERQRDTKTKGVTGMATYTFFVYGEERTVEADSLDEAREMAGIGAGDFYDVIEPDDLEDRRLISAITDDILFGS